LVWLACGALFIELSLMRLAGCGAFEPAWPPCDLCNCAVGAALGMWGWSRLRRAKEARPDWTWWRFLEGDLRVLALFLVLAPVWLALSPEQRDQVVRSMQQLVEWMNLLRGRF
jgi:hypothetical protein